VGNNKYVISIGLIEELKRKGYNQTQIAQMFDVSRQAVSYHKVTYNGSRTPREAVRDDFPWKLPSEISSQAPARRIRDLGEFVATGGKGMQEQKLTKLRNFLKKLKDGDLVLEYNPDFPPIQGFANKGGFRLQPRRPSDGDLLIRNNKHTRLTKQGRMIWRFPPVLP
jgi:hypothetical protein